MPKKLGLGEGQELAVIDDPGQAAALLEPLPRGARIVAAPEEAEVVLWFVIERRRLDERVRRLGDAIFPNRSLWVAWPKRTSGVATDVTEDVVREVALPLGLVDNKVCAIDATWSGLRLVWRRELRTEPATVSRRGR